MDFDTAGFLHQAVDGSVLREDIQANVLSGSDVTGRRWQLFIFCAWGGFQVQVANR
jgi:hypothetical protein